jgi:hypothetical protein
MVLHEPSRRAIARRYRSSGLRSILNRNPDADIAQNEAVFSLERRIERMYPRTQRALNCAVAWGFIAIEQGAIVPRTPPPERAFAGEAQKIRNAAVKLGYWAGTMTTFEYFTVLGVSPSR